MVDLPVITRVPVPGQPEDIFEQMSDIIKEYITPKESIIVNVLSATVDFTACESIRMSRKVDKTGERTLAVVTKVDKAPEGLLEKVTINEMNVELGYVCVKNCIGNKSYEEALCEEARLFETHAVLSKMDKSMVSIPLLAHKLVQIQANIISKCFLDIMKKINDKLAINVAALNELPQHSGSVAEALATFMRICSLATESLKKFFLKVRFDECTEDFEMQCAANTGGTEACVGITSKGDSIIKSPSLCCLPGCFAERVSDISATTREFLGKLWNYIEVVVIKVLLHHAGTSPELQYFIKRAVQNLIARRKDELVDWVGEIIGTDRLTDLTSNPEYVATYSGLVVQKRKFMKFCPYHKWGTKINIKGFGDIDVLFLRWHPKDVVQQAFELKMMMVAYWKIVFSPQKLGNDEIKVDVVNDQMASLHLRFSAYWKFAFGLEKLMRLRMRFLVI